MNIKRSYINDPNPQVSSHVIVCLRLNASHNKKLIAEILNEVKQRLTG